MLSASKMANLDLVGQLAAEESHGSKVDVVCSLARNPAQIGVKAPTNRSSLT